MDNTQYILADLHAQYKAACAKMWSAKTTQEALAYRSQADRIQEQARRLIKGN